MASKHVARIALWVALSCASLAPEVAHAQRAHASIAVPERPERGLLDAVGVLDLGAHDRVEGTIADVEARSGVRLAVAVVSDTGRARIEDYSLALFRAWRLGEDTRGRGALLVVAVRTRKNYLEVGSAMVDVLPDDERTRILVEVFRPTARSNGPGAAVEAAMVALRDRIAPVVEPAPPAYPSTPAPTTTGADAPRAAEAPIAESPSAARLGWGLLALLAGAMIALQYAKSRRLRRESFADKVSEYERLTRRYETLTGGARGPAVTATSTAYRSSGASQTAAAGRDAFIDEIEVKVAAARLLPEGDPRRAFALDEALRALSHKIAPLEAALRLREELDRTVRSVEALAAELSSELERAPLVITKIIATWPGAHVDFATSALARATAAQPSAVDWAAALRGRVDARAESEQMLLDEARRAEREIQQVLENARAPMLRHTHLVESDRRATSLNATLHVNSPPAVYSFFGEAPAALHEEYARLFYYAFEGSTDAGDPEARLAALKPAHEVLERIREVHAAAEAKARRESAARALASQQSYHHAHVHVGGPSMSHGASHFTSSHDHGSSYDASSFAAGAAMAASSDCASSDCASSDCASSDCASSDCASSDCASSDCASSDCSRSDCSPSDCAPSDCAGSGSSW